MAALKQRDVDKIPTQVFTDLIFFHKSQLRLGMTLHYMGRTAPNSFWLINRIWRVSHKRGVEVKSIAASVGTLNDILELKCGGETKYVRFGYLSYSAIWRI